MPFPDPDVRDQQRMSNSEIRQFRRIHCDMAIDCQERLAEIDNRKVLEVREFTSVKVHLQEAMFKAEAIHFDRMKRIEAEEHGVRKREWLVTKMVNSIGETKSKRVMSINSIPPIIEMPEQTEFESDFTSEFLDGFRWYSLNLTA